MTQTTPSGKKQSWEDLIRNHIGLIIAGFVIAGFTAGFGAAKYFQPAPGPRPLPPINLKTSHLFSFGVDMGVAFRASESGATVIAAGLVGGFYFAFTYERWKKESLYVGVLMTFLLHSSFNLVGVVGVLFLR